MMQPPSSDLSNSSFPDATVRTLEPPGQVERPYLMQSYLGLPKYQLSGENVAGHQVLAITKSHTSPMDATQRWMPKYSRAYTRTPTFNCRNGSNAEKSAYWQPIFLTSSLPFK